MNGYTYKHEDLERLKAEANGIGNLSANLDISYQALKYLLDDKEAIPNSENKKKIARFATGKKQIQQIKRRYRRK